MKILVFDWEATGAQRNKANPFDPRNVGCVKCVLEYDSETKQKRYIHYVVDHPENDWSDWDVIGKEEFQKLVDDAYWIVGMNLKYDIHWSRRYGINLDNKKYWDIQVLYFIMTNQLNRFPSLNEICEYYGLPKKLDIVSTEYWDNGLDTDVVPLDILLEYCDYDVELTFEIFQLQVREFKTLSSNLQTTIRVQLEDLETLEEMEWNGFKYDLDKSFELGETLEARAQEIRQQLSEITGTTGLAINWGSTDQVSAVLFGGTIIKKEKETYEFTYKDIKKAPVIKERWVEVKYELPQIYVPDPKSKLKKGELYSVSEEWLRKLKTNKSNKLCIELLLELAKNEKMSSTYMFGLPKQMELFNWGEYIHTNFNQCVVVTGRLSSSKPNGQNIPEDSQECFISRF